MAGDVDVLGRGQTSNAGADAMSMGQNGAMRDRRVRARRTGALVWTALLFAALTCLTLVAFAYLPTHSHIPTSTSAQNVTRPPVGPIIGGFSITTTRDAQAAALDGVGTVFTYTPAYTPQSALGQTLTPLHMNQVEAQPWALLYQYECHRLATLGQTWPNHCAQGDTGMTLNKLLAGVQADLFAERHNSQLIGYWALDDWPISDPGAAASILPRIAALAHQITPGLPVICGFGPELEPGGGDNFDARLFANYTPTGCDAVALYIYSASVADPGVTPTTFDWSMRALLPKAFAALRARGWNPARSPLIGIPQAWAGDRSNVTGATYEIAPTTDELTQQSASFCQSGASGIVFYAWDDSTVTNLQTPGDNLAIRRGVRQGIAACKRSWSTTQVIPWTPPALVATPTPAPQQGAADVFPQLTPAAPRGISVYPHALCYDLWQNAIAIGTLCDNTKRRKL